MLIRVYLFMIGCSIDALFSERNPLRQLLNSPLLSIQELTCKISISRNWKYTQNDTYFETVHFIAAQKDLSFYCLFIASRRTNLKEDSE